VSDSLIVSQLNAEILTYYISKNLIDSAILYVDTFALEFRDPIILELYYQVGKTDSIRAIIARWTDTSQDGSDLVEIHTIMCDLMEDSVSINEMDPEDLSWIRSISESDSEAGWMAKGILNTLFGNPLELPCELTLSCDEARFADYSPIEKDKNNNINFNKIKNYPDPFDEETTISLNFDENLVRNLKIHIFDIQGKLISELAINSKTLKIGKDLHPGLYIYKITGENYTTLSGKMVKIK